MKHLFISAGCIIALSGPAHAQPLEDKLVPDGTFYGHPEQDRLMRSVYRADIQRYGEAAVKDCVLHAHGEYAAYHLCLQTK
jgi:hypothetical protein